MEQEARKRSKENPSLASARKTRELVQKFRLRVERNLGFQLSVAQATSLLIAASAERPLDQIFAIAKEDEIGADDEVDAE